MKGFTFKIGWRNLSDQLILNWLQMIHIDFICPAEGITKNEEQEPTRMTQKD